MTNGLDKDLQARPNNKRHVSSKVLVPFKTPLPHVILLDFKNPSSLLRMLLDKTQAGELYNWHYSLKCSAQVGDMQFREVLVSLEAKLHRSNINEFYYSFDLVISQYNQPIFTSDDEIGKKNAYACALLLVAMLDSDATDQKFHTYVTSKAYYSIVQTNYFSLDLGLNVGGHQFICIQSLAPQEDAVTNLAINYYTMNKLQAQFTNYIDDAQQLERALLDRAKKYDRIHRFSLYKAKGWRIEENIRENNLCYLAYRIQADSQHRKYRISSDDRQKIADSGKKMRLYYVGRLK